jgi:hypothetical protein
MTDIRNLKVCKVDSTKLMEFLAALPVDSRLATLEECDKAGMHPPFVAIGCVRVLRKEDYNVHKNLQRYDRKDGVFIWGYHWASAGRGVFGSEVSNSSLKSEIDVPLLPKQ